MKLLFLLKTDYKVTDIHYFSCRYRHFDLSKEIEDLTTQLEAKANLSSNPSEYYTPNETQQTEEESTNSEFLEKLSKVINEPLSGSSYNTAFDQTNNQDNDNINLQEQDNNQAEEILDDSIITISDGSSSQLHISGYEFITNEILDESESPVMTHMKEECQDLITSPMSDVSGNQKLLIKCEQLEITNSSVNEENEDQHSSSSFSNISDEAVKHSNIEHVVPHFSANYIQSASPLTEQSFSDDLDIIPPTPQENHEGLFSQFNFLSKISEKTEFTSCHDSHESVDSNTSRKNPEIKISHHGTSPVQIPEINLIQFDDSCDFDDTLEEMNRFLEQGTNYVMPRKSISKLSSPSSENQSFSLEDGYGKDIPRNNFSPISGSFMRNNSFGLKNRTPTPKKIPEKNFNYYSAEKITKPSVEVKGSKTTGKSRFQHMESKIKPPSVNSKALFAKTSQQSKPDSAFKLPSKPIKKTPSKILNPLLKNVVSPVGVYINHTPKYCPMIKNKPQSRTATKLCQPGPSSFKENIPVGLDMAIPSVIYKPAKTKFDTQEQEVNLPENIKKLISPQVVTKHERRIEADARKQSVERRLLESELSIDVSQCDQDTLSDISILTHKQPFNLKKY